MKVFSRKLALILLGIFLFLFLGILLTKSIIREREEREKYHEEAKRECEEFKKRLWKRQHEKHQNERKSYDENDENCPICKGEK